MPSGMGHYPMEDWVPIVVANAFTNVEEFSPRQVIGAITRGTAAGVTGGIQGPCYGIAIRARVTIVGVRDFNTTLRLYGNATDPTDLDDDERDLVKKKDLIPVINGVSDAVEWGHYWIEPQKDDVMPAFSIGFVAGGATAAVMTMDMWRRRYILSLASA